MKKTLIFSWHFLIANTFFYYLNAKTPSVDNAFESLKSDLEKISFPYDFVPSYLFYTISISFSITVLTILFKNYFSRSNNLNLIVNIFFNYLISVSNYLFVIFFFKIFIGLNRIYVLFFLFFLLFLSALTEVFFTYLENRRKFLYLLFSVILFLPNFIFYPNSFQRDSNFSFIIDENVIASESLPINSISSIGQIDNLECNDWKGSNNYVGCIFGISIDLFEYDYQVSNLVIFKEELYILLKNGLIYKQSNILESPKLYADLSSKVYIDFPGIEQGLYSIAFHPTENYFVVSYSNNEIALVVEKYNYSNEGIKVDESELLIKIANNQRYHFGGSLIWSDYFNDFLLGIGDMKSNVIPVLQSDPLNTTSYKGKIVLLNSLSSNVVPLIAEHNKNSSLKSIVAYGLRNPWQFMEYENKLFITDVGSQFIEELNILNLSNDKNQESFVSASFGWPLFSGLEYSTYYNPRGMDELIYTDGSVTDLYYFEGNNQIKADKYLKEKSISPIVFYEHVVNQNVIRAAIIGGDIIVDKNSKYFQHYFFTDYVERELFAYDFINDKLYVFPLPSTITSNPTSVKVSPFEEDTILISFRDGNILYIKLP